MSWDFVKFSDLFDYENKSKIKAGNGLPLGQYPFYTSSNELSKYLNEYLFDKSSLIFGTGGNASIHYCNKPFAVSTDCLVAFPKDHKIVEPKFVYYYLLGNINLLENGFKGAGLKHISKGYINDLLIPLPPLATQKRIAEILDAADALKRKDQQLLKKYDELAQAIFIDMFGDPVKNEKGWEVKKLGEYIAFIGDIGSNGSNAVVAKNLKMFDTEDYAIMIRTTNLAANDFKNRIKYISKDTYEFYSKSKIWGGEIIMNKIGSAGDFWIMPKLNKPVSLGLNQFVIRLSNLNTKFIFYYLSSDYGRKQIKSNLNGAVTKSITKSAVKGLPLYYPPIELQNRFEEIIEKIELLKWKFSSNKETGFLFENLIQKAFNGELVN